MFWGVGYGWAGRRFFMGCCSLNTVSVGFLGRGLVFLSGCIPEDLDHASGAFIECRDKLNIVWRLECLIEIIACILDFDTGQRVDRLLLCTWYRTLCLLSVLYIPYRELKVWLNLLLTPHVLTPSHLHFFLFATFFPFTPFTGFFVIALFFPFFSRSSGLHSGF